VQFLFAESPPDEARIELMLNLLRYAGRELRTAQQSSFKQVLAYLDDKLDMNAAKDSRLAFLVQEVTDIRTNKASFAALDRLEAVHAWLRTSPLLRNVDLRGSQLSVPFLFLREATPEGWADANEDGSALEVAETAEDPILTAASRLRLNTDARRQFFVAIADAVDTNEAATRLRAVTTRPKQVEDACTVVVHCCLQEKGFNLFYLELTKLLCRGEDSWAKRFRHSFKRVTSHHFSAAHEQPVGVLANLASWSAGLIRVGILDVTAVRFLDFGAAEEGSARARTTGGLAGKLGLLLAGILEDLVRELEPEKLETCLMPVRKFDDVRGGLLLVLETLVRSRLRKQDATRYAAAERTLKPPEMNIEEVAALEQEIDGAVGRTKKKRR
jgi:hypothetical protein